jgi:lipopolysaccharide/colanic/teichoic acid biosynthesis glycosyltransferase
MTVIPNPFGEAAEFQEQRLTSVVQPEPRPENIGKVHVIPVPHPEVSRGREAEALYRVFEIELASIGLMISLPLMLLVAVVVRLDSPGPALFRHKRPARSVCLRGRDLEGRPDLIPPPGGYHAETLYYVPAYFTLMKFRTMHNDARTRFPDCFPATYARENFRRQFPHIENDPRITRVGRVLRRLSVDELPNLWSVVVGDMRIVGPRPEAPEVLKYHTPEELIRFTCKPGITGLAQISGRKLLTWGETIALDLEYVRTRSVALDLKIILLTVKHLVTARGAP